MKRTQTNKPHFIGKWILKIVMFNILLFTSCEVVDDLNPTNKDLPDISLLAGEWLRVDGNSEVANGMKVNVSGTSSTILDPSATIFSNGDIKWKDISPSDKDLFEHQELGSDGNYYAATIKMINDNEIEINVVSSGNGNFQKWIRVTSSNDYVKLQGIWLIIDSIDPSKSLGIDVKGSAGKVIVSTNSSFSPDDIIWKDIQPSGTDSFTFLILDPDGNYVSATITIISENEIEIVVGSADPEKYNKFDGSVDLSKLQGAWTRVESNNPTSDYMQVNVTDDQATVIEKAQSGFSVGDIKWKDIVQTAPGKFSHKELGGDYQYYDATITMLNDTTLQIAVASSGDGNNQKWVRNAPAQTIELDCNISSATTLINGPAEVDYRVTCVLDVTAALTIEPGVVIEFENNGGLGIYDNGSLNAVGTADKPIVLKGLSGTKGSWRGIHTETNSVDNRFEYVAIQDAGSNYVYCCNEPASLLIKDGQFSIKNSTLENGAGIGMYVHDNAKLNEFSNITIITHDEYPMSTTIQRAGELDGRDSDYSGNGKPYIEIRDSDLEDPMTLKSIDIPYLIDKVLDITAGLTIEAGAKLVMKANAGIGVYDDGFLNIQGSDIAAVQIIGYESVSGYWRGIHMETNSINNKINHAVISDAGSNYVYCCNDAASIFFKSGKAAITNTAISRGKGYGVYAGTAFEFSDFENNDIATHEDVPMYIAAERIGELDGMGSDYSGNTEDYIAIFNSDVDNAISWSKTNVPYLIDDGVIDIKEKVEIEHGAEIVFAENAGLGVYDNGVFNAVGTSGENIIFRGKNNIVGFWRGIHIETNSQENVLDYCNLSNAGSNYVYCCNVKTAILADDGLLKVTNCSIENSGGCGLAIKPAASVTESGNTFSNNTDGSICE